jgi:hypothetical protein
MSTQRKRNHLRIKWYSMLHRDSHSGRPALVCHEWRVYECFAADVGEPPDKASVLCMRDPQRGFCKDNVFWGTSKQRLDHRRHLRTVTVGSETLNLTQWAERIGIHRITLSERLLRHDEATAVTVPKLPRGGTHISKSSRRRMPRVHVGLFDREAVQAADSEQHALLHILQACQGDTTRLRLEISQRFGPRAADIAMVAIEGDELKSNELPNAMGPGQEIRHHAGSSGCSVPPDSNQRKAGDQYRYRQR